MVRVLRRLVGRRWIEVEAELDRFCASMPENAEMVQQAREWLHGGPFRSHRLDCYWNRAADGFLWIDATTGRLVFASFGDPKPAFVTAAQLRREPVVIAKGKKKRR